MNKFSSHKIQKKAIAIAIATLLSAPGASLLAATTELADLPLANATTANLLPNIYIIVDTSGSMSWDYLPDSASSLAGAQKACSTNNKQYYDPMVTYEQPKDATGTTKSWGTDYTKVPYDGYKVQSTGTADLTGGNAYYYSGTTWCKFSNLTTCQATQTGTYKYPNYCSTKTEIKPAVVSYPGPNSTTRTYAQEIENFARWHAWYRTRMQTMKTALSLSLADIRGTPNTADPTDKNYFHARIGMSSHSYTGTTDGGSFLHIDDFNTTHKATLFNTLFNINPTGGTPLRSALDKAGQIYSGTKGTDPVQYSCQRNFTILTTDGYWNGDNTFSLADQDGAATVPRPSFDSLKTPSTLADIAYKYYHTDLRPSPSDNSDCKLTPQPLTCNNVPPAGSNANVDDVATWQHMTTFTVGLGVNGTLSYLENYKTATTGDYFSILQGSKNWPKPVADSQTAIDDLWHTAVNGRGTYFSAKNPQSLVEGLSNALGSMSSKTGSGASAGTSNLEPVEGDNFIYIASYRTVNWDGELSAYTIDVNTGAISSTSQWKAGDLLNNKIAVDGKSDTRKIYTWSSSATNKMKPFTWTDLTATEQALFDPAVLTNKLSQYVDWSTADKTAATGASMVNFLRGQNSNEDQVRDAAYGTYYRLYRDREKVLGDIVHSQPILVGQSFFEFDETKNPGYSAFKTSTTSRIPTLYVGANDGMLHALKGSDGIESWSYVPPMVMKNMYRTADKDYATNHRFMIDGPTVVSDVRIGGQWRTILVGALGKGGRGYYALDITDPDPTKVKALWNFSADNNANMGYSFGAAMITKLDKDNLSVSDKAKLSDPENPWVVVIPSGYNNIPEGSSYATADGVGRLFVLDAANGNLVREISTGVGSVTNPAGLAHVNLKITDFQKDNVAVGAYAGDLLGNMWRFNLDTGAFSKVASLPVGQQITVAPEIGKVDGHTALWFGSGQYLGSSDLENTKTQSFYAIKDDGTTTVNVNSQLVKQTMADTDPRAVTGASSVDWNTYFGWYVDLPTSKERVSLPALYVFGTIIFASTIPEASACNPGGYSYLYFLSAKNGLAASSEAAVKYSAPLVGITLVKLKSGKMVVYGIQADGEIKSPVQVQPSPSGDANEMSGRRVIWRELTE